MTWFTESTRTYTHARIHIPFNVRDYNYDTCQSENDKNSEYDLNRNELKWNEERSWLSLLVSVGFTNVELIRHPNKPPIKTIVSNLLVKQIINYRVFFN